MSAPIPAAARPRQASSAATSTSGDSEARGAIHWISTNSLMFTFLPVSTSPCANGSAEAMITAAANMSVTTTSARRRTSGSDPIARAGPTRSTFSDGTRLVITR